jgi:heme oxygenase
VHIVVTMAAHRRSLPPYVRIHPHLDLLTLLRERTREQHSELDAALDFNGITTARYGAFLRGIAGVVTALEPAIARYLETSTIPSRTERIRADLAALGLAAEAPAPRCALPRNIAEAYGCAYVLEGSALGGIVLARLVQDKLGVNAPIAYLRLRGKDTAGFWRTWIARVNAFGASSTPHDHRTACDAACATFDAYFESLRASGAIAGDGVCPM